MPALFGDRVISSRNDTGASFGLLKQEPDTRRQQHFHKVDPLMVTARRRCSCTGYMF
jgi:hypothetical protein